MFLLLQRLVLRVMLLIYFWNFKPANSGLNSKENPKSRGTHFSQLGALNLKPLDLESYDAEISIQDPSRKIMSFVDFTVSLSTIRKKNVMARCAHH